MDSFVADALVPVLMAGAITVLLICIAIIAWQIVRVTRRIEVA